MHGDLWLFCGLHMKILQSDKFGEKMTVVLVLCPIFLFPFKFMFIFHFIKVAVIQKIIWWPHILKVPSKQLVVCCTSWKNEMKIDGSLSFTKIPDLHLIIRLRVTGLCVGNSPGTGELPAQMASNAENVSIWWRNNGLMKRSDSLLAYFLPATWMRQSKHDCTLHYLLGRTCTRSMKLRYF